MPRGDIKSEKGCLFVLRKGSLALCRHRICLYAPTLPHAPEFLALGFEGGIFIAFGFGRLTRDPSVLRYHRLKIKPLLSSAMVFNQISQPRQRVSLHGAFSELDALFGSKTRRPASLMLPAFSNLGTSPGSETSPKMQTNQKQFSNLGTSPSSKTFNA